MNQLFLYLSETEIAVYDFNLYNGCYRNSQPPDFPANMAKNGGFPLLMFSSKDKLLKYLSEHKQVGKNKLIRLHYADAFEKNINKLFSIK